MYVRKVLKVKAPWMKSTWTFDDKYYVIPNMDTVVVGGTLQKYDWNIEVSQEDTDDILDGICEVFPGIRSAPVVSKIQPT